MNLRYFSSLFLAILSVIFLVSPIEAAPAYGTRMPEKGRVFGGLQYHQIIDRELGGDNGSSNSRQYFALLSYGIFDWLSIDLKGGLGDTDQQALGHNEINYPTFLTGGYGFRIRLYQDQDVKTKVVAGFQHISVHPYAIDVNSDSRGDHFKVVIDDWQLSLLGSRQLCKNFTIYAGGRLSSMDSITWINGERNRIKPDRHFGAIVGGDISLTDRTWLNIEGNFVDAEAVAASLNFAF